MTFGIHILVIHPWPANKNSPAGVSRAVHMRPPTIPSRSSREEEFMNVLGPVPGTHSGNIHVTVNNNPTEPSIFDQIHLTSNKLLLRGDSNFCTPLYMLHLHVVKLAS